MSATEPETVLTDMLAKSQLHDTTTSDTIATTATSTTVENSTTTVDSSSTAATENNDATTSAASSSSAITEVHESDNAAIALLDQLEIPHKTYAHEAAFTCEQQLSILATISGVLTKNLFLKDKKYGLYLVSALDTREINMKLLHKMLGLSGANLRLADEQLLMQHLGVARGSVSPLALLHDTKNEVKFCIDKDLLESPVINIHPLRCDRSTSLSGADLHKFLKHIKHEPIVLDFNNASL